MKATDIVDKFKKILLSETEEKVEEIEVQEEVKLAEEEIEEVKDEVSEEDAKEKEEVKEEEMYATKEELSKAIAEMKAMYDQLMESMSDEKSPEVPEELKEEVELSSQESETEPIAHSPESNVEKNNIHLYGNKGPQTIMDRVLNKIS
tara:strand:- start:427 stop:870 length:444 start_codon:yes stop_codon:yes gene_type:complete